MKRTWTIIGVANVARSLAWYQSLLELPPRSLPMTTSGNKPLYCTNAMRSMPALRAAASTLAMTP